MQSQFVENGLGAVAGVFGNARVDEVGHEPSVRAKGNFDRLSLFDMVGFRHAAQLGDRVRETATRGKIVMTSPMRVISRSTTVSA